MCYLDFRYSQMGAASGDRASRIRVGPDPRRPSRSTAGPFPCASFQAAPNGAYSGSGTAMERGPRPSRQLDRGFADEPLSARPKARRGKSSRAANGNAPQEIGGEIFCLQTLEISRNREIFTSWRGQEDASRWKPAMTEGASPKVPSRGSRPTRRRNGRGNFPGCKPLKYHKTGK
jgi:hypothetical protein